MTQAAPSAREGSAWAGLEAVYRAELPGIRRLLTARTGSAAEADDIAQDLWLRLRAVPVGPIANPVGYLYRMALNLAVDRARGERRRVAREADWGITHETRLADAAARWPWLVGVALLSTASELNGDVVFGPVRSRVTSNQQDISDLALFGEATAPLTRKLGLTAGVRIFRTLTHARELGDETEPPVSERVRHISATPSVALLWKAAPRTRVYARFASAIRPGGVSPGGSEEPQAYEDDDLESIEAGARHTSRSGAFAFDLNGFALHWRGVQADLIGASGLVTTANVGEAENHGVTLGVTSRPSPGWRIEARGTAQHPTLVHPAAIVAGTRHAGLPAIPGVSGNVTLAHDRSFGRVRARFEMTLRYIGRSRLSFDPGLERTMGDYELVRVGAAVDRAGWTLGLRATNLLDDRADSFAFGNPFTVRTTPQRTSPQPRSVTLQVGRAF